MNDNDLLTTMRESFTDVRSATPVDQIVSRSRVIRARRRIPGAVAAVAVAAVAGITVALIPSGPARPVATQTTAYVVSHVARALDAMPAGTVVAIQRTTVPARTDMDTWNDGGARSRQEGLTPTGQRVWESGQTFSSSATRQTTIFVNYDDRTWWRTVRHLPAAKSGPTVWTCSNAAGDSIVADPSAMADQLRTALSCGELKVVGSGTLGGVPAVKLSGVFDSGATVTYWVNAATYLPFRFTSSFNASHSVQEDLQWLPPTAANLARLNVTIPAGFTQVRPGSDPAP
jgi:hypothetical protein